MNGAICGFQIDSVDEAVEQGWTPYYFCNGAAPIASIPQLSSITFWEGTTGPVAVPKTFQIPSAELGIRLSDPLGLSNRDFRGASQEHYDVFYSDANGTFHAQGAYITVEAVWNVPNHGGGLNIAEITLNFVGGATQNASVLTAFFGQDPNDFDGS
jgi:hypothetical protein